ncbi:rna-directed dna polymerase from mobile element hypothetical protein [Limosa lapponica baueri]|uniref:RNA-directed DNA polymerase from mobile element jockey n=1 Tax=Limosa lapponica baueri TaxID=1758121 RepID=A0A2I0U5W6_LIMLA|nr:rna-directed dna polymerase from mobile element hypothetical protein [Limosa lapponica baueri]
MPLTLILSCLFNGEQNVGEQNEAPIIQEELVSDVLHHFNAHKSLEQDGIHPRVLRELADVLIELLSILYQQSWLTGEIPVDWRLANVTPIRKRARRRTKGTTVRPQCLGRLPSRPS